MGKNKVSDYSEQIRGVSYKPDDLHDGLNDNSIILLRANNISDGEINLEDLVYVDKSKVSEKQLLRKGDILVCASSGSKHLVGKAAQVDFNGDYTFGAFCKVVRPVKINSGYLGMYFQSSEYRKIISSISQGANINNIKNENIDNLLIKVPGESKQIIVAEILTKVSKTIKLKRQQLDLLDNLIKSRFVELFGKVNDKIMLKELCDVSGGYSFKSTDIINEGIKLLQISNVALNKLNWDVKNYLPLEFEEKYSNFLMEKDDIVMALTRPIIQSLGNVKTCIVNDSDLPCLLNQRVGKIKVKDMNQTKAQFIYHCFMTEEFTRYVETCCIGCSQPNISTKDIESYGIPDVSIELQDKFAVFVQQVEKLKVKVKNSLDETQVLFDSLMLKYFD